MARSRRDTLIFATILLSPMAVATAYVAFTPTPDPIVLVREIVVQPETAPATAEPTPDDAVADELTDEVAPAPVDPPELVRPAGAGLLVYEGQVALTTAPDVAWAKGKLRNIPRLYGTAVSRAVDPARLPEDLRALADTRMVLYSPDGSSCTAETAPEQLRIYGRQDGDALFGRYQQEDDGPAELLATREQVFAEAQLLLARPRPATTDTARRAPCDGLWARRADLPAPAVFVVQPVDRDLRATVLAELAEHPAVQVLAAEYATYRDEREPDTLEIPRWSTYMKRTMEATRWDEIGGARSFVNVVVGDGGMACTDEFTSRTAVLFALEGDELVPQTDPGFMHPLALMDLERDGHLEAVTDNGGTIESRGPIGPLQSFEIPYHGCPC